MSSFEVYSAVEENNRAVVQILHPIHKQLNKDKPNHPGRFFPKSYKYSQYVPENEP